jgi:thiol-disulfide isomerase/thioredoxin
LSDLRLLTLEGETVNMDFTDEKAIFLNYWATWCGPCIAEMPSIERLAEELDAEEVVFLIVSDESLEKINAFLRDKNFTLPFAKKILDKGEKEMRSFPQTYLIGGQGQMLFEKVGSSEWDSPEMVAKLKSLINSKNGMR